MSPVNGVYAWRVILGGGFAARLLTVVASCNQQEWRLLDFLATTGQAVLQGAVAPSLLPALQGD